MERKLASVRKIEEIKPIVGADKICAYRVGGWWVVDGINKYKVGDLAVYFEIDSYLPIKPEYEFLRKSSYKKLVDGTEGFRLKTVRLRGQISQGLLIPLTFNSNEGEDVTVQLNIVKYDPPVPVQISGDAKGVFPSFIPKTDEERIQNFINDSMIDLKNQRVYITEKLDGTSYTVFVKNGEVGVCSRNFELKDTEGNAHWSATHAMDLVRKLTELGRNIALQGELVGNNIQGNPYKVNGSKVYFFTGYDIDNGRRMQYDELDRLIAQLGLNMVPVLEYSYILPSENIVDSMLQYAEGKSVLNPLAEREGVVVRGLDAEFSFKAISNKFLLDND